MMPPMEFSMKLTTGCGDPVGSEADGDDYQPEYIMMVTTGPDTISAMLMNLSFQAQFIHVVTKDATGSGVLRS